MPSFNFINKFGIEFKYSMFELAQILLLFHIQYFEYRNSNLYTNDTKSEVHAFRVYVLVLLVKAMPPTNKRLVKISL